VVPPLSHEGGVDGGGVEMTRRENKSDNDVITYIMIRGITALLDRSWETLISKVKVRVLFFLPLKERKATLPKARS